MNVARILYPIRVLGPGERVGIWLRGCSRGCPGCSNPELWDRREDCEVPVSELVALIGHASAGGPVDGFTITGGEPFDQAEELAELLEALETISDDFLLYSGYRLADLVGRRDEATDAVLRAATVLVDGPYVEELNDGSLLRGSSNQRIHVLNDVHARRYGDYLASAHNQIQNFPAADGVISVGIHRRSF